MKIGPYTIEHPTFLAPIAGVTDRPFRILCRNMGAGMAISEMVTSQKHLWNSRKTQLRLDHRGEASPRSVQIAGTDPQQMADAARFNVDHGAQIIDINMGCPAKKVCNVMAGSALMKNEQLVASILDAVVNAVDAPVTLKMRTGWDPDNKNALQIANIAEQAGIQALSIHGRTRACGYRGDAEYDTIAEVKSKVNIPVIANGDITCAKKAARILQITNADAVMIGRAAQGRPWIFREINHYLKFGKNPPEPDQKEIKNILINHLENLYDFYGEEMGVRIARKHISWYCKQLSTHSSDIDTFWQSINKVESTKIQLEQVAEFLSTTGSLQVA